MLAFFSLANLSEFCAQQLGLYTYQNYIELFFFVLITNKTLTWLKKDHTKHLLFYTYSYFALLFASYSFSCTILFSSMIIFSPVTGSIFAQPKKVIMKKAKSENFFRLNCDIIATFY